MAGGLPGRVQGLAVRQRLIDGVPWAGMALVAAAAALVPGLLPLDAWLDQGPPLPGALPRAACALLLVVIACLGGVRWGQLPGIAAGAVLALALVSGLLPIEAVLLGLALQAGLLLAPPGAPVEGAQDPGLRDAVLEQMADGLLLVDAQGGIALANAAARQLLADGLLGRPVDRYLPLLREPGMLADLALEALPVDVQAARESGEPVHLEIRSASLAAPRGGAILRLSQNHRRLAREAELERLALNDSLTGLPNRVLLHDRIDQALRHAERSGGQVALMLLDLDRFKQVNDTLGHHVGDLLLQQVGPRLSEPLRRSDTLARLGGDEFAVLLPMPTDRASACAVAERLVDALAQPIAIEHMRLSVGVSIGVALYPDHGEDREGLMQQADLAMYRAKRHKLGFVICDDGMPEAVRRRQGLRRDLGKAIARDELQLLFQRKVHSTTGEVIGFEGLLRWHHPALGLLEPSDFLEVAEQTGELQALTLWVINACLREQQRWQGRGVALPISINLAASSLRIRDFAKILKLSMSHWGAKPERLILEVPESAVMADVEQALPVLQGIAELGCGIILDDFGSGYSSLVHLPRLPVRELKIHRQFVTNMETDPEAAVVVRSIVRLAHGLGLRVVATGVENARTAEWLAGLHCDTLQGHHFGRPVSGDAVLAGLSELPPAERARAG